MSSLVNIGETPPSPLTDDVICERSLSNSVEMTALSHETMAGKKTFKYFGYGSNLLKERILVHNPTAEVYAVGKLNNFRFSFETPVAKTKSYWHGAVANIREASSNDYVMGLVWDISLDEIHHLDRQEKHYRAINVPVVLPDCSTVLCRTYQIEEEVTGDCLPDPYYKKVIVSGAKQNGLPEEYVQFLESFEVTKDTTVPKGYKKVLEIMEKLYGKEGTDNLLHEN